MPRYDDALATLLRQRDEVVERPERHRAGADVDRDVAGVDRDRVAYLTPVELEAEVAAVDVQEQVRRRGRLGRRAEARRRVEHGGRADVDVAVDARDEQV